jgi:hypothetical protein
MLWQWPNDKMGCMQGNVVCEGILAIFLIIYKPIGASPLGQLLLFGREGKGEFLQKRM